jgi:hypothetical protein
VSRYTTSRATAEVAEQLRRRGRGAAKQAALAIGRTEQAFSAKMRGRYSSLSVEEFGLLAEFWGAPTGWPWVPWELGEVIDRTLAKREGT